MKNEKLRVKKIAKKKKIFTDYSKKRDIFRNNIKGSKGLLLKAGDGILPKSKRVVTRKELRTK